MAKDKGTRGGKGHASFVADSGGRGNGGGGRAEEEQAEADAAGANGVKVEEAQQVSRMDFTLFLEMATDQHQAIQIYVESQVMEKLADTQRAKPETIASRAQTDDERRGAQPEKQGSRGSDNLLTDQPVEWLTKIFEAVQRKAEKQRQSAAATITQAGTFDFSQISMRMSATFDGSFKVGEDPPQNVLIFTSQMNAYFGQQRCLEAVESLTTIKVGQPNVDRAALEAEFGAELVDQAYRAWSILITTFLLIIHAISSTIRDYTEMKITKATPCTRYSNIVLGVQQVPRSF